MWCFWRCPLPSCAGKQTFSHTLRIHPFAKLHYGSEIWISAWTTMYICLLKCFLSSIILGAKCKKTTIHASIKISILFRNNFLWIKNFFTNLCPRQNVNFKFWFPVSKEHNYGKFSSNIKSKDSFKIRIVLAFQKCPKLQS